jgi:hypothetical protein
MPPIKRLFMTAMKKYYKFANWKSTKSTKDSRNIGPQTEAILLVFYDILCFFSQTELGVFLGYVSPNHNVDGALVKMVEEEMLVKASNKVGTPIYYLGHFAIQALDRTKLPDKDDRQNQFLESIKIRSDNGFRVRNKRQNTARTSSSNKGQEPPASKKSGITPSAKKKARTNPKPTLSSSDEELPKRLTEPPPKDKDGTLTNNKSTSDDESEKDNNSSSSDDESETSNNSPSSEEESEKSEHSSVEVISIRDIMKPDSDQFEMAANHIIHSNHSSTQHPSH